MNNAFTLTFSHRNYAGTWITDSFTFPSRELAAVWVAAQKAAYGDDFIATV